MREKSYGPRASVGLVLALVTASLMGACGPDQTDPAVPRDPNAPTTRVLVAAAPTVIYNAWTDNTTPLQNREHEPSCVVPLPSSLYDDPAIYLQPQQPFALGQMNFPYQRMLSPQRLRSFRPPNPGSREAPSIGIDGELQEGWGPAAPRNTPNPGQGSPTAPPTAPPTPSSPKPASPALPSSPQTIIEADIIRQNGERLYVLSAASGLHIYSLQNPMKPKQLGQQLVAGKPVEMLVDGRFVYVFVNRHTQSDQTNTNPSQSFLISIDVMQPESPKIVSELPLPGSLWEGGVRKKGAFLYVVSFRRLSVVGSNCSVFSIQRSRQLLASAIKIDDKGALTLGSSHQLLHDELHRGTSFRGLTITMTESALLVSEYREGTRFLGNCGNNVLQKTVVNVLAINPAQGGLKPLSRFSFEGFLTDQHKQTHVVNQKTRVPYFLGLVQVRAARGIDFTAKKCTAPELQVANRLISVSLQLPRLPKLVHSLSLGKLHEEVRGSLFDHKGQRLYAITTETSRTTSQGAAVTPQQSARGVELVPLGIDPLYVISLQAPKKPVILKTINGLDGEINFFRTIQDGQFLLAVGRDRTGHCTGFRGQKDETSGAARVAVSLLDIRTPAKARLVQRRCFGFIGRGSRSDAQLNLDQGHKQIAFTAYGQRGTLGLPVRILPLQGAAHLTAIGMMDIDLTSWAKAPQTALCQTCLKDRPAISMEGKLLRVLFPHLGTNPAQPQTAPLSVLGLTEKELVVAALNTPDAPVATPLSLPSNMKPKTLVLQGGSAILHPKTSSSQRLTIHSDITGTSTDIHVENLASMSTWEGTLLLLQYAPTNTPGKEEPRSWFDVQLRVLQLSTTGKVETSTPLALPHSHPFTAAPGFVEGLLTVPAAQGAALLKVPVGLFGWTHGETKTGLEPRLFFVDLRKPMKPMLQEWSLPQDISNLTLVKQDMNHIYASYTRLKTLPRVGTQTLQKIHFFAMPIIWKKGKWQQQGPIEVPGALLGVHRDKAETFYITGLQEARDAKSTEIGYKLQAGTQPYTETFVRIYLTHRTAEGKAALLDTLPLTGWTLDKLGLSKGQLTLSVQYNWFAQRARRGELTKADLKPQTRVFRIATDGFAPHTLTP